MQWWSFIRKFQMMSWTSFIFTENLQILFFFEGWAWVNFTQCRRFHLGFCFDEHFWLNFFFFVLANQSKGMSVWHQKKLLLFGRISYKIYKSWILLWLTEICDSFVLLRWFFFFTEWGKILEIKRYSVILNECKKSECVAFSLIFFAPYHVWLYKNQINLDASGLFLAAL